MTISKKMKQSKKIIFPIVGIVLTGLAIFVFKKYESPAPKAEMQNTAVAENSAPEAQTPEIQKVPEIKFIGPRENIPSDAPKDYGFWSFAIVDAGKLSRSGQPTIKDFQWLKDNGWKGNVDLRIDNDHNEPSNDAQIQGFNALGFNYLRIQMTDGAAPTMDQAKQFLDFATKPENQPVHVHCRGGIGRAGVMVALYRYAVDGWPIDQTIEESKLFQGGVDESQQKFLRTWAQNNAPGSWGK
jgi:protein tyrosine phosphatase (PTP) superfamily phosphohydrolase (DUF442 family)